METQFAASSFPRRQTKARPSERHMHVDSAAAAAAAATAARPSAVCPPRVTPSSWHSSSSRGVGSSSSSSSSKPWCWKQEQQQQCCLTSSSSSSSSKPCCWRQQQHNGCCVSSSTESTDRLCLRLKSLDTRRARSLPRHASLLTRWCVPLCICSVLACWSLQQLHCIQHTDAAISEAHDNECAIPEGEEDVSTSNENDEVAAVELSSKVFLTSPHRESSRATNVGTALNNSTLGDTSAAVLEHISNHQPRRDAVWIPEPISSEGGEEEDDEVEEEGETLNNRTAPEKRDGDVWIPGDASATGSLSVWGTPAEAAARNSLRTADGKDMSGSAGSAASQDNEDGDIFELDITDGQPVLTDESEEALSFIGVEGGEHSFQLHDPTLIRRRYSGSEYASGRSTPGDPDIFFTAKESLFNTLYKKASLHREPEAPLKQVEKPHGFLQEHQQQQSLHDDTEIQSSATNQQRNLQTSRDEATSQEISSDDTDKETALLKEKPQARTLVPAVDATKKSLRAPDSQGTATKTIMSTTDRTSRGFVIPQSSSFTTESHDTASSSIQEGKASSPKQEDSASPSKQEAIAFTGEAVDSQKPASSVEGDAAATAIPVKRRHRPPPLVIVPLVNSPSTNAGRHVKSWQPRTPEAVFLQEALALRTKALQESKAEIDEEEKPATQLIPAQQLLRRQRKLLKQHRQNQRQQRKQQQLQEEEDAVVVREPVKAMRLMPSMPDEDDVDSAKRVEDEEQPEQEQQQHPSEGHTKSDEAGKEKQDEEQQANKAKELPSVFAARRDAERWEPCGRWTNFVFLFVNPASGDRSGAHWVSRTDASGHYQTKFKDTCTRVHLFNLRHGDGGAPEGFQLLQRVAAVKYVLSVRAAEETWTPVVVKGLGGLTHKGTITARRRSGINFVSSDDELRRTVVAASGTAAAASGTPTPAFAAAAAGKKDGDPSGGRHSSAAAAEGPPTRPQTLIRVIAVGGDGTVSWVNRAASDANISPEWISIGVVGFGTGNDFAHSYGWGGIDYSGDIFKGEILKQYVHQWQSAEVVPHDVWRVNIKTSANGYFEHVDSSTRTFKKIVCEKTGRPSTVLSGFMSLYFGIGFEALLGLTFDMSRSTSRLRNRMLYGLAFFKHFSKPWRLASDQIESVYVFEGGQKKVLFTTNHVKYSLSYRLLPAISLTFIGTETILGGVKVWPSSQRVGIAPPSVKNSRIRKKYQTFVQRLRTVKQDMGDKKLEIISFRNRFSLMRSVMYEQNAASRLMQHRGPFYVKFYPAKVSGPVPFQVDGEFFLSHHVAGAEVKYEKTFYVLKQNPKRSGVLRVADIIDALGSKEKDHHQRPSDKK